MALMQQVLVPSQGACASQATGSCAPQSLLASQDDGGSDIFLLHHLEHEASSVIITESSVADGLAQE